MNYLLDELPYYVFDIKTKGIEISPALSKMIGYGKREVTMKLLDKIIVNKLDKEKLRHTLASVIKSKAKSSCTILIKTKQRHLLHLKLSISFIKQELLVVVAGGVTDTTEEQLLIKELEEVISQIRKEKAMLEARLSKFTGATSLFALWTAKVKYDFIIYSGWIARLSAGIAGLIKLYKTLFP